MTDELETIRARHEADDKVRQYTGFLDAPSALKSARHAHNDRATLLALVDRLSAELAKERERLKLFMSAACPVATEINPRGYNWSEAYLDQARAATLTKDTP